MTEKQAKLLFAAESEVNRDRIISAVLQYYCSGDFNSLEFEEAPAWTDKRYNEWILKYRDLVIYIHDYIGDFISKGLLGR